MVADTNAYMPTVASIEASFILRTYTVTFLFMLTTLKESSAHTGASHLRKFHSRMTFFWSASFKKKKKRALSHVRLTIGDASQCET